jgi:hypothetical protein
MAKPGEIRYDFAKLDAEKEFQDFLRQGPPQSNADDVNPDLYKKGGDFLDKHFLNK